MYQTPHALDQGQLVAAAKSPSLLTQRQSPPTVQATRSRSTAQSPGAIRFQLITNRIAEGFSRGRADREVRARLAAEAESARLREVDLFFFTQDIRFDVLARKWQRESRMFTGMVEFGHQLAATIGQFEPAHQFSPCLLIQPV